MSIYLDGIPLTQAQYGVVSLSDLPLQSLDRIEVYRGSAPISFHNPGAGVVHMVTREISVLGSCGSSGEIPECIDLLARGDIDVDPIISLTAPLDAGPELFARLHSGDRTLMKVILRPCAASISPAGGRSRHSAGGTSRRY